MGVSVLEMGSALCVFAGRRGWWKFLQFVTTC